MRVVLLLLFSISQLFAQSILQVIWENSEQELLRDLGGTALLAGYAIDGDGCVVQLGYYSSASAAEPFKGSFIPLTGIGATNTRWNSTYIGDGGGGDGRFSFNTIFQFGSATTGNQLPAVGTPLSIRFFDGATSQTSIYYNAVSAGTRWAWKATSSLPGELLMLSLGDLDLVWLGGTSSAFRTTLLYNGTAPVLTSSIEDLKIIKGSSSTLSLFINAPSKGFTDAWQLYASDQATPISSGTVSGTGQFNIPLQYLTQSGNYFVRLSRTYTSGEIFTSETKVFHLTLDVYSTFAGNYEALIKDSDTTIPDGATYRGVTNLTLNTYGTISGRIRFNKPQFISGSLDSQRNYTQSIRSFVCTLAPSTQPNILSGTARLYGLGVVGEEAQVILDINTSTMSVVYKVPISPIAYTGTATSSTKLVTTLAADQIDARGRYSISSESEPSYFLFYINSYGTLYWTHRAVGYTGSGATKLTLVDNNKLSANIFEFQIYVAYSVASRLSRAWIGPVSFIKNNYSAWDVSIGSATKPNILDFQSSCLTYAGIINWAQNKTVTFPDKYAYKWNLPYPYHLFTTPTTVELTGQLDSTNFATTTICSVYGIASAQIENSKINFRIDRFTGEISGYCIPIVYNRSYKRMAGQSIDALKNEGIRSVGWFDNYTFPFISSGTWNLK